MTALSDSLVAWEHEWRRLGVPLDELLGPPRDPSSTRELLERNLGIAHPDLVTWFSWHDGSAQGIEWPAAPTGEFLMSLEDALSGRDQDMQVSATDPDLPRFDTQWLPLTVGYAHQRVFDSATGEVLLVDWHDADFTHSIAGSLQEAVSAWTQVLEANTFAWDQGARIWLRTQVALPVDLPYGLVES